MDLSNNLKKRFCKDFKLPIVIFEEPYFTYFKELYEPIYAIDQKLNWLDTAIQTAGGTEEFFNLGKNISSNIKTRIENTEAYKKFNSIDVNKNFPLVEEIKNQNIYIDPNIGKDLISVDLNKANFNCLDLFDLKKEINAYSYDELMKQETDLDYYLNSKMIRQVIFGDLNPARQQRIQKYIINQLCSKLIKAGCELSSASSDEIIIKSDISVEEVKDVLSNVDEKFKFFRVESFKFDKIIEDRPYYAKVTKAEDGDKLEFKNIPSHFFAQVYKEHFNLAIHPYDMLFYHEDCLAEFKKSIFGKEVSEVKSQEVNKNKFKK